MRSLRSLLSFLAVTALATAPGAAFARFGKSDGDSSSSSSSGNHQHSSSGSNSSNSSSSGTYHPAHPVGSYRTAYNETPYRYENNGYGYGYYPVHYHRPWYGWGFGYYPVWGGAGYYGPQPVETAPLPFSASLGFTGQAVRDGGSVGFQFAMEGDHYGLRLDSQSFFLRADDGSGVIDTVHLIDTNLSFALVATNYGRLRLEGGLATAVAPDITFFGPDFGLSGAVGLFGPVSFEFGVRGVPYPFRKLDANAGLSFPVGALALRAGWRATYLDDEGQVDGIVHVDTYSGPYLGLALAF